MMSNRKREKLVRERKARIHSKSLMSFLPAGSAAILLNSRITDTTTKESLIDLLNYSPPSSAKIRYIQLRSDESKNQYLRLFNHLFENLCTSECLSYLPASKFGKKVIDISYNLEEIIEKYVTNYKKWLPEERISIAELNLSEENTRNLQVDKKNLQKLTDEQELIIHAIAFVYLTLIRQYKLDFLNPSITLDKAKHDFSKLQNYTAEVLKQSEGSTVKADKVGQSLIGKKTSDYFSHPIRNKARDIARDSLYTIYHTDNKLFYVILNIFRHHKRSVKYSMRGAIQAYMKANLSAPTQIHPSIIPDIVKWIRCEDKKYVPLHAIDPCGGWGDPLVAFLAFPQINYIVYNDLNFELQPAYQAMVNTYAPRKINNTRLLEKPAESLTIDDICFKQSRPNFLFCGLPFYKKEIYQEDPRQASEHETVGKFANEFLLPTLYAQICAFQQGGYMVFNLANYCYKGQVIDLQSPFESILDNLRDYLKMVGKCRYLNKKVRNKSFPDKEDIYIIKRTETLLQSSISYLGLFRIENPAAMSQNTKTNNKKFSVPVSLSILNESKLKKRNRELSEDNKEIIKKVKKKIF